MPALHITSYWANNVAFRYPASEWRQAESGHRRGPKTVPAQTAEVMSFSLFSLDF